MQYSPKLKNAMEEIKAVLKKHDIGASVILHTPGFTEYLNHIDTSYSCLTFEGDQLRIQTKGRSYQHKTDSINMVSHFAEISTMMGDGYTNLLKMIQEKVQVDETPGNHTGHTEQNN
jgi:hypothetical protein